MRLLVLGGTRFLGRHLVRLREIDEPHREVALQGVLEGLPLGREDGERVEDGLRWPVCG